VAAVIQKIVQRLLEADLRTPAGGFHKALIIPYFDGDIYGQKSAWVSLDINLAVAKAEQYIE
jgi:hypothetical protein